MGTIPASRLVDIIPSVLEAAGTGIEVVGLLLTENTRPPIGTVPSFPSQTAVADYFGASSQEASLAGNYFEGFENSSIKPDHILFAQYPSDDVAAYLRGGDVSAMTLAEIQAISGTLIVTFDGTPITVSALNLSTATSFSSAAGIIEDDIEANAPAAASVTGSIGGIVTASAGAAFTGAGSGTNLTASSVTGVIHIGAAIAGTGVPAGTYIISQTSGSAGGAGVYVTNHATTSSSDALIASSNTLDVTGVTSGTLQAGDAISGTGVATGTTILAQTTGSPGSTGLYTISSQQHIASATVTSLSTVLNVTAVGSGALEVGAVISGTAVTSGSQIVSQGTGSGGTGTYNLSLASTTISETIASATVTPTVTYDSTSGAFVLTSGTTGVLSTSAFATGTTAATLKLTSATGAVLSQGADAATPAPFMTGVIGVTTDWVTFMTTFAPDVSGNTNKLAFAAWKDTQNDRYAYIVWDTDAAPTVSDAATGSLGYLLAHNGDSGSFPIWAPDATTGAQMAAFVCGAAASIDFESTNGRITFAGKWQDGLTATVTDDTVAENLLANGYNFGGAYGAANQDFIFLQDGHVTGDFAWLDSYINQIWLNNQFQITLMTLLKNSKSIPFSTAGNSIISQSLADPIAQGLSFGAFGPGDISSAQIAEVNADAGARIADTLQTQGSYLQIGASSSAVRRARGPKRGKFYYLDRGSVQTITLNSIAVP